MQKIGDDWKEFLAALAAHRVEYMVVGGIAVGVYGHVRYTKDLDVWFRGSQENAGRLAAALGDFGIPVAPESLAQFCKPRAMPVLGQEPNAIELINFADGVEFDACFPRRTVVPLAGADVAIIGLERFAEKQARRRPGAGSGRPRTSGRQRASYWK